MAVNKIARKSSKFRVVFTVPDFCWPPPPAPPNSLALHIDRQTQGYLKLHTPDGISLTYQDEPVFWSFFSHDLYDAYLIRSYAESWQAY